jgi:hypothetical protein
VALLCDEPHGGRRPDPEGPRTPTQATAYRLVSEPTGLPTVLRACAASDLVGVDVETTGLDPHADRVHLLQLAPDAADGVFVLDLFAVSADALAPLFEVLRGKTRNPAARLRTAGVNPAPRSLLPNARSGRSGSPPTALDSAAGAW